MTIAAKIFQALRRRTTVGSICLVIYIINVVAFYPGFLPPDSLDQYAQAVTGVYNDWHPPAFPWFWSLLIKLYEGPFLMLVLQLACLWGSVYLLMKTFADRRWQIPILIFGLAPFVQNFAGAIVKDSQMALSWLLSFTILFRAFVTGKQLSIPAIIFTLVLLLYGTYVRPNALSGAVPLYFFWAWVVFRGYKRYWTAFAFLLICFAGISGHAAINMILKPGRDYPENKLFLHDLTGIFVQTGKDVFPPISYTESSFDTAYLRTHYQPATFDNIFWNKDGKMKLTYLVPAYKSDLRKAWFTAIKKYPAAYLKHRANSFLYFLKVKNGQAKFFYAFFWVHPNEYGFKTKATPLWYVFAYPVLAQGPMFYMKPWFWLLLNILLLVMVTRLSQKKYRILSLTLLLSALLYLLPQFFISQTDTEFRYIYWNCIACTLALLIYIHGRREQKLKVEISA